MGSWGGQGGRGRKEERWKQANLLPNLWGPLTASDHLASSPSPVLLLWKEQQSLRLQGGAVRRAPPPPPPPRPQHTQRLFFCIEFLLPSSHCISFQEAQSRPFPTYDPGTLGPKRWKKVMYQFIALRRCCAWPLLLEN